MATVSCLAKTPHDNVGNHYEPFKNRIMAKKIYALYRTDNWHTYDSRELLVVAGSIRRCCKVAKDDGATKEQIEDLRGYRHQSQCTDGTDYEYDIDTYTLNESLIS